jgi:hypothetical protein
VSAGFAARRNGHCGGWSLSTTGSGRGPGKGNAVGGDRQAELVAAARGAEDAALARRWPGQIDREHEREAFLDGFRRISGSETHVASPSGEECDRRGRRRHH